MRGETQDGVHSTAMVGGGAILLAKERRKHCKRVSSLIIIMLGEGVGDIAYCILTEPLITV